MQRYAELESGLEEGRCSEEHTTFDLQCGDSLTIAANRIGEEVFGVKRLLQRSLRRAVEILFHD